MRIALVTTCFPEPSQTFVFSQIRGLLKRGLKVDVYGYRSSGVYPSEQAGDPFPVFYFDYPPRHRIWRAAKLLLLALKGGPQAIKSVFAVLVRGRFSEPSWKLAFDALQTRIRRYDVILCHFGTVGLKIHQLRKVGGIRGPLAIVFHGYDLSVFLAEEETGVYSELLSEGDCFLPVSEHWADLLTDLGAPAERVVLHRMGVDLKRFPIAARPSLDRHFQIISIGRLTEKKGIGDGIRAFARLSRELRDRACYLVVGDGPLRLELEALVNELGVQDSVKLLGWLSQAEIVELLGISHLLLAPSKTAKDGDAEGVPVVLMEAMARGLPVLSTKHSGIPELVEDGISGFLVEEGAPDALADRLKTFMAFSDKELTEMGRSGRDKIERDFEIENLNDRLVEILARVATDSLS